MAEKHPSAKTLRELPEAEAQAQLEKLQADLWQQRVKAREGALQQTHLMPLIRRQIARINTILRERQLKTEHT